MMGVCWKHFNSLMNLAIDVYYHNLMICFYEAAFFHVQGTHEQ
jgi:hypothetical protein